MSEHNGGPALKEAIDEVSRHASALVREEIELAKAEVALKVRKLGKGAAVGAAAGIFVLAALMLILHGVAWLLWYLLPFGNNTIFWGFFIEAALLLMAAVAGLIAARAFKAGSPPTPQLAIDEAQRIKATVQHPEEVRR